MIRSVARFLLIVPLVIACGFAYASSHTKIILSVSGKISSEAPTEYSIAMLENLPMAEIVTKTPWHDGPVTFEGVPLKDLMSFLGATGENVEFIALNDYRVAIPASDFSSHNPILAYRMNGELMSVRNKGPLFVIYPFDDDPELNNETYYARSVWQVRSIVVD